MRVLECTPVFALYWYVMCWTADKMPRNWRSLSYRLHGDAVRAVRHASRWSGAADRGGGRSAHAHVDVRPASVDRQPAHDTDTRHAAALGLASLASVSVSNAHLAAPPATASVLMKAARMELLAHKMVGRGAFWLAREACGMLIVEIRGRAPACGPPSCVGANYSN